MILCKVVVRVYRFAKFSVPFVEQFSGQVDDKRLNIIICMCQGLRDVSCETDGLLSAIAAVFALLLQPWDGAYHVRRKNGENFSLKCRFIPVTGHCG